MSAPLTPPRAARAAVAVQFATMGCITGSWAGRIPTVRAQTGLDDAGWGLATVAGTIGSLLSMVLVLTLIGRVGPRRTATAGAVLLVVDAPLLAAAHHPAHLVIGLLVQGVATGLLAPAMNAQAVVVEREYRRRIMSGFHACFSLGQLTGGLIGAVSARLGVVPTVQLAVTGAVLLVLLLISRGRLPADPPTRPAETRRRLRARFTPQLTLLAVIALLASVNEGSAVQWSAQYTAGTLLAGGGAGALTFSAYSVSMVLARAVGDRVVGRLGRRRFLVCSELLVATGMTTGLLLGSVTGAVIAFVALGLGSACIVPTVMGLAGNQPGTTAGEGVSVVSLGQWPAFLIGPPLIGAVAGLIGLRGALGVLVVAALAIVLLARFVREPASDEMVAAAGGRASTVYPADGPG
ncbi:MFS transporter [Nakamurella sp. YIM 132087]|uniref:MFS transporter n=1 Tax=Nakamurella alba TaxID=2665158 RepID=A0A7K1FMS0_9ACTN|nr:MFS transporter [Nakamurella alba]MTD15462.1 MFS transporter [Nakamurella alba]